MGHQYLHGRRDRHVGSLAVRFGLGIAIGVVFLLPLVFMVAGSLREPGSPPPRTVQLVPSSPSTEAYGDAFDRVELGRGLRNSLVVVAVAVPVSVLCASWAGFAVAMVGRRARWALIGLAVAAVVVPSVSVVVGRFVIFERLGVLGTYVPLLASSLLGGSPLFVLLYAWSFWRLPREYLDIGRLAALGPLGLWARVAMPLVRPVTVAVAVLSFAMSWGNALDPLVYLTEERTFTLPLVLRSLSFVGPQDAPVFLAGAVVATVPVVAAFVCAQRFIFDALRGRGWEE